MSLDYDLARTDKIRVAVGDLTQVSRTLQMLAPSDGESQEILSCVSALLATLQRERPTEAPDRRSTGRLDPEALIALASSIEIARRALTGESDELSPSAVPSVLGAMANSIRNFASALAPRSTR